MPDDNNINNGRVIITYGRSLMALTAAYSLSKNGIEVIGCDDVDMTVTSFSRHVSDYFLHAPYQTDLEQYLDDLEENIRKFQPEDDRPYVLMPMFRDTKIIAEHRARFEPFIKVAAPHFECIQKVNSKDAFAETCEKFDLRTPKTIHPENIDALETMKDDLEFPLMIKPIDGVGGRGIHKADNYEVLHRLYENSIETYKTPPLVQQVIEGRDYCLSALCDRGKIIAHMAYKNLYQFPHESGAGIMRETIDDAPFLKSAEKLIDALKWNGIAQIDFRWSGKDGDDAYLIEANPRFWAGLFHSVESGIDFPWLLYQLTAYGEVHDVGQVKIGAKTKMPGLWAVSAIQDIAESETNFKELECAWKKTWNSHNKESWRKNFAHLKSAIKNSVDGKDIIQKIKAMQELSSQSKSELIGAEDDPFIGLGFLFLASSLLRHGQLPPELKNR